MPSLRFAFAQAAGGVNVNVLAGSKFEFLPVPSMIEVYGCSDVQDTAVELTMGNVIEFDQVVLPQNVSTAGGDSGGPHTSRHKIGGGVGAAGDRVVLKVTTPTASVLAAGGVRLLVVITPV